MAGVVSNPGITYNVLLGTEQVASALFLNVPSHDRLDVDLLAPTSSIYNTTDIVDYATAISIRRGRQRTSDRFDAGSATVELYDATRRFDPTNTAGPLYGKLHPGFPLSIEADGNEIFFGWTTAYDYEPLPGDIGRARITASDTLSIYANAKLSSDKAFSSQLSGARIQALMEQAAFLPQYSLDAGEITISAKTYAAGTALLDAMGETVESEWGRLFADRSGKITFRDRTQPATTGTVEFRPNATAGTIRYRAIGSDWASEVFPVAAVTDDAGAIQTDSNLQYLLDYNGQTLAVTYGLLTSARAATLAAFLVARYAEPFERPIDAEIVLTDETSAALQASLFQLDLADAAKIVRTYPTGSPATLTEHRWIESIEHTITRRNHTVRISFGLKSN